MIYLSSATFISDMSSFGLLFSFSSCFMKWLDTYCWFKAKFCFILWPLSLNPFKKSAIGSKSVYVFFFYSISVETHMASFRSGVYEVFLRS